MSFIGNALGQIFGSVTGANQQAQAATDAAQTQANAQLQAYQMLQGKLAPYSAIGTSVLPQLLKSLGYQGTFDSGGNVSGISGQGFQYNPFSFNPSDLQNTPGYQFTLQQGQKGVNNSLSSQGLLGSGAQAKALSDYTTGLANTTYNSQYNNALNAYNANYASQLGGFNANVNPLVQLLTLGQNSAAGTGQGQYNAAVNAGNATAQGTIGSGAQTANTFNSLLGMANLANTAGASYSPTAGYQSGLSNIYSAITR